MSNFKSKRPRGRHQNPYHAPTHIHIPKFGEPDPAPRAPGKKEKPIVLRTRKVVAYGGGPYDGKWFTHGRYLTREIAEKVLRDFKRKWPYMATAYEFKIEEEK